MAKRNTGMLLLVGLGALIFAMTRTEKKASAQALPGPLDHEDDDDDANPVPTSAPMPADILPHFTATSPGLPQVTPAVYTPLTASMPASIPTAIPTSWMPEPGTPPSLPTLQPADVKTGEIPIIPAPSASLPTEVDQKTLNMVATLLAREGTKGWKKKEPIVGEWQRMKGLKSDNMFGPKTALLLAQEFGVLPLVRYWPKGSQPESAVDAFRDSLEMMAAAAPEPRHGQLLASAAREQGQGFGTSPGVPATLVSV